MLKALAAPLESVKEALGYLKALGPNGITAAVAGLLALALIGIVPSTITQTMAAINRKMDLHISKQGAHNVEMQKFREHIAIQSEMTGEQCALQARALKDLAAEVRCNVLTQRARNLSNKINAPDAETEPSP